MVQPSSIYSVKRDFSDESQDSSEQDIKDMDEANDNYKNNSKIEGYTDSTTSTAESAYRKKISPRESTPIDVIA